jgi:hypothetical protein
MTSYISLQSFLTLSPEFTWFKSGPYLKDATAGKDVWLAAVTIQLKKRKARREEGNR